MYIYKKKRITYIYIYIYMYMDTKFQIEHSDHFYNDEVFRPPPLQTCTAIFTKLSICSGLLLELAGV